MIRRYRLKEATQSLWNTLATKVAHMVDDLAGTDQGGAGSKLPHCTSIHPKRVPQCAGYIER